MSIGRPAWCHRFSWTGCLGTRAICWLRLRDKVACSEHSREGLPLVLFGGRGRMAVPGGLGLRLTGRSRRLGLLGPLKNSRGFLSWQQNVGDCLEHLSRKDQPSRARRRGLVNRPPVEGLAKAPQSRSCFLALSNLGPVRGFHLLVNPFRALSPTILLVIFQCYRILGRPINAAVHCWNEPVPCLLL
jgi:hypothetical protein